MYIKTAIILMQCPNFWTIINFSQSLFIILKILFILWPYWWTPPSQRQGKSLAEELENVLHELEDSPRANIDTTPPRKTPVHLRWGPDSSHTFLKLKCTFNALFSFFDYWITIKKLFRAAFWTPKTNLRILILLLFSKCVWDKKDFKDQLHKCLFQLDLRQHAF